MSNINREIDFSRLSTVLGFALEQRLKDVHTSMPGLIETYDAQTRRARVQPALRLLLTDGTTTSRAPVVNVPVVFPAGGGFTLLFPVEPGDGVLLVFSQRGIAGFKRAFAESDPTADRFFDPSDAVALPGFGAISVTPATTDGASLQSEDGLTAVRVEATDVLTVAPGRIDIDAGDTVEITAASAVAIAAARIDLN